MCVDYKNVAIDFKRGTSISMSLRGVEDVFELIDRPDSPRLASEMTIRDQMIKDIYCSLLISEQNTGINTICEYLEIEFDEYKWAIHFPAFIRKMATEQADALINALNEKQ